MEVLQDSTELEWMRDLLFKHKPHRILEIGCWDGGTLYEWLSIDPDLVVAIDDNHRNSAHYDEWRNPKTNLVLGKGLSQSDEIKDLVHLHAPYDWAFIDADHDEMFVRADVNLCLSVTKGLILMHDITPGPGCEPTGPGIVFDELKADHKTLEYTHQGNVYFSTGPWEWAHGIGVVFT